MARTFGLEVETLLIGEDGSLVPEADKVLDEAAVRQFHGALVPEGGLDMVELNSGVSHSLDRLETMLRSDLRQLAIAARGAGTEAIPQSSIQHGSHPKRFDKPRYLLNPFVFGEGDLEEGSRRINLYSSCSGTHLHVSREPGREVEQYNLMSVLDPSFVLLSATPFIDGRFLGSAARTAVIRNEVFTGLPPILGELLPYASSKDEFWSRQNESYALIEGRIGAHPSFHATYRPENSIWGPLRVREATIEARNGDANLVSLIMAHVALYKGVMGAAFDEERRVVVGNHTGFVVHHDLLVLPYFRGLKGLEREAIRSGLSSEYVRTHLNRLVDLAESGLPEEERRYLAPYQAMLIGGQTLADVLGSQFSPAARSEGVGPAESRALQRQFAQLHAAELENPAMIFDILAYGREALPPLEVREERIYVPAPVQAPYALPAAASHRGASQPRAA